jgi:hypothetical protein
MRPLIRSFMNFRAQVRGILTKLNFKYPKQSYLLPSMA